MRKIIYKPAQPSLPTLIRKRNLVFFDLEFSGLNFDNEIMAIGCVLVEPESFKVVKEWSVKVRPEKLELADKEALEIIGYSEDAWREAVSLKDALEDFNSLAKDTVLVGYNCSWDVSFLMRAYWEQELEMSFHWQVLDVLSMAYLNFFGNQELNGFRMSEIRKFFSIEIEKSHDALEDARATYKIFMKLIKDEK